MMACSAMLLCLPSLSAGAESPNGGTMVATMAVMGQDGQSQERVPVIPLPQNVQAGQGYFTLTRVTKVSVKAPKADKKLLTDYLEAALPEVAKIGSGGKSTITLKTVESLPGVTKPEGYTMTVRNSGVEIHSTTGAGLFYGIQTLLQMARNGNIPVGTVTDEPRFDYRGMMLDVSRHFLSKQFVEKQIDAMAHYKLNRLHIHLTDAAGWRIEIKQYPRLTDFAAWRPYAKWKDWTENGNLYCDKGTPNAYGGYYTQDDIREIVEYARKQYITVIPEIEMPGHSEEVLTAFPELSCTHEPYKQADFCVGNEATFTFLENVLTEVMELFPSEYIHIGGDEAAKKSWPTCPLCQQRMKDEGLKDVNELQSYLIRRMERFLNSHGRKLLGWDEILEGGLAPNATVMSWRGTEGGLQAIAEGHRAIMTPGAYCYFDSYQDAPSTQPPAGGYLPLEKVYSYDPIPDSLTNEQRTMMYGVQANLWAENIPTPEHMEYMIYPRLLALAEVAWTQPEHKDFKAFRSVALGETEYLGKNGYHTFDLKNEVGERTESLQPIAHLAVGKKVTYADGAHYYPTYTAGGDQALADGVRGGWSYGDNRWQGFISKGGLDVVIDLEKETPIHSVAADFMQICGPGVFMPAWVEVSVSADGENYTLLQRIEHQVVKDDGLSFKNFGWHGDATARYIHFKAGYGEFGGFLFTDEIVVE